MLPGQRSIAVGSSTAPRRAATNLDAQIPRVRRRSLRVRRRRTFRESWIRRPSAATTNTASGQFRIDAVAHRVTVASATLAQVKTQRPMALGTQGRPMRR